MKHNYKKLWFWSVAYTFRYLSNSSSLMIAIFKSRVRLGNAQSEWGMGNGAWGSPIAAIAPPVAEMYRC